MAGTSVEIKLNILVGKSEKDELTQTSVLFRLYLKGQNQWNVIDDGLALRR